MLLFGISKNKNNDCENIDNEDSMMTLKFEKIAKSLNKNLILNFQSRNQMKINNKTEENMNMRTRRIANKENIRTNSSKRVKVKNGIIHFSPYKEVQYIVENTPENMNKLAPYDSQKIPEFFVKKDTNKIIQEKEHVCLKLYNEIHHIKEKQNKLSSRKLNEELKGCTFAPTINYIKKENSSNFADSLNYSNRRSEIKNVVLLIKYLRLTSQHTNNSNPFHEGNIGQKSISEIQECTFIPNVNKVWRKINHNRSLSPKGFEKAVNRLSIASKLKAKKNSVREIKKINRNKSHSIPSSNTKNLNTILIEINIGKDKYLFKKVRKNIISKR